jgi:putative transposase
MLYTCKTNLKKISKTDFKILSDMCNSSRALYNSALYELNNFYEETEKYLGFNKLDKLMKNHISNPIYKFLPAQISQQILRRLDKNFISFFKLLNKKRNKDYDERINTPNYLPKNSKYNLIFQKQSFRIKNDKICLSIPSHFKKLYNQKFVEISLPDYIKDYKIKQIEIKPMRKFFKAFIIYEINEQIEPNLELKN